MDKVIMKIFKDNRTASARARAEAVLRNNMRGVLWYEYANKPGTSFGLEEKPAYLANVESLTFT